MVRKLHEQRVDDMMRAAWESMKPSFPLRGS